MICFKQNIFPNCEEDADYQTSTSTIVSTWDIPDEIKPVVRSAFWSIDARSPLGGMIDTIVITTLIQAIKILLRERLLKF